MARRSPAPPRPWVTPPGGPLLPVGMAVEIVCTACGYEAVIHSFGGSQRGACECMGKTRHVILKLSPDAESAFLNVGKGLVHSIHISPAPTTTTNILFIYIWESMMTFARGQCTG